MATKLLLFIKTLESMIFSNKENILELIIKKTKSEEKKQKALDDYNEWESDPYRFGDLFKDNNSNGENVAAEIADSITKRWTDPIKDQKEYIEILSKEIDKLTLLNEKLLSFIMEIKAKQTKQKFFKNGKFRFISKIICWCKKVSDDQIIENYKVKLNIII